MPRVHCKVQHVAPHSLGLPRRNETKPNRVLARVTFLAMLGALSATPALAADIRPLSAGPLLGDGSTTASIHVLLPPGTRLRASTNQGKVQRVQPVAGGAVIVWTPPLVQQSTKVPLQLKVRGGGIKEDLTHEALVVPGWTGGFRFSFDKPQVAPGGSATVTITATSPGASSLKRKVKAKVSHGTLTPLVPGDGDTWTARYTAPSGVKGPVRPLFIVTDLAAPTDVYGTASFGVTFKRSITLDAPADSKNTLVLGGQTYGPVTASPSGKIVFDLDLHPDFIQGELTTITRAGDEIVSTHELPVPVPSSVVWMPLPPKVGAATDVDLLVTCRTGANALCSPIDLSVQASAGSMGLLRPEGDNVLRTTWTVPSSGTVTLKAVTKDQTSQGTVPTIPGPLSLTLTADPTYLAPRKRDFKLKVRAKDMQGKAVTRRTPFFRVQEARLTRRPVGAPDGTYTGTWRINYNVKGTQAAAWARVRGTGLPVHRLVAWPAQDVLDVASSGKMPVFVAAEDAFGMPVPYVTLSLAVPVGDGSMVSTFKTDASGVAAVPYSIGATPGPVRIEVQGAGLATATTFWQGSVKEPVKAIVRTGSASDHEAVDHWRKRVATVVLPAGKAPPPVTAPVAAVTPVTPVAATPGTPGTQPIAGKPILPTIRPPKARPVGQANEYAQVRLRALIRDSPVAYSSTLKGASQQFAPEAKFSNAMHLGVHGDAELWVGSKRSFGLDLRARAGAYRVNSGIETATVAPLELEGGARYRLWDTGTWSAYAGAGVSRTQSVVFAYSDEARTNVEVLDYGIVGFRAGGGVRGEFGPSMIDINVQTVWAPGPNMARAEIIGEVPITDGVLLSGGIGADARSFVYRIDDSNDNKIKLGQRGLDVRVGLGFPFF